MKASTVITAILTIALSGIGPAYADNHDRGRDRNESRDNHAQRGHQSRNGGEAYRNERQGPGAGRDHNYYRGDRLPHEYRDNSYVVDDWRGHQLRQPPRGYHWVQTGPDYVLVAIASGIIAQILLGH